MSETGKSITITRDGKPVADLSRAPVGVLVKDLPAIFASLPHLSEEEAEAFA